jgi:hypothetical protein
MGMFLGVPFIGVVAATWRTVLHVFGPTGTGASGAPQGVGPAGAAVDAAPPSSHHAASEPAVGRGADSAGARGASPLPPADSR